MTDSQWIREIGEDEWLGLELLDKSTVQQWDAAADAGLVAFDVDDEIGAKEVAVATAKGREALAAVEVLVADFLARPSRDRWENRARGIDRGTRHRTGGMTPLGRAVLRCSQRRVLESLREWTLENASTLTDEDWESGRKWAAVDYAGRGWTHGSRFTPDEWRALFAYVREVAEGLSDRMAAGLKAVFDGGGSMLAASLKHQLTSAGLVRDRKSPDAGLEVTTFGRAVARAWERLLARHLELQQGDTDAG